MNEVSSIVKETEIIHVGFEKNEKPNGVDITKRLDISEKFEFNKYDGVDISKRIVPESDETREKKGGSYKDVKKETDSETKEVHHMPADSSTELSRDDGPAIKMDKEDHRQTASCGNSKEAKEYREKQKELIDQGKFREAFQMDVDDIHEKFGDKYDDAIAEASEYVDKLEQEGKI